MANNRKRNSSNQDESNSAVETEKDLNDSQNIKIRSTEEKLTYMSKITPKQGEVNFQWRNGGGLCTAKIDTNASQYANVEYLQPVIVTGKGVLRILDQHGNLIEEFVNEQI